MNTLELFQNLAEEGNHVLVRKLIRADRREIGFGTIVVPENGFSDCNITHNAVIDWLRKKHINICNPGRIIAQHERVEAAWQR
jgi:hypothetical protein